jgi:hypothetical protein
MRVRQGSTKAALEHRQVTRKVVNTCLSASGLMFPATFSGLAVAAMVGCATATVSSGLDFLQ